MIEDTLSLPRNVEETKESLNDPLQRAILEDWAAGALQMWLRSPTFRVRASYSGKIVPALFDGGGLPKGGLYHSNVTLLLRLWKEFSMVRVEESRKGWESTDCPSSATLSHYRWRSRQPDPEVSCDGARLLHRDTVPQQIHSMVIVDLTQMADDLLSQLDPPSLLAKTQKELSDELDVPPRVVKEMFRYLTSSGKYKSKMVKISGVVKRVLVPVVTPSEEGN